MKDDMYKSAFHVSTILQTTKEGVKTVEDSSGVEISKAGTTAKLVVELNSPKFTVSFGGKEALAVEWTLL